MSTTTKPSFAQPALFGGLVAGVLSALPIISAGNFCCCLWVVGGGAVAAYVLQQNTAAPVTPGDGALAGLLAGLVGAFVHLFLSIPLTLVMAPMHAPEVYPEHDLFIQLMKLKNTLRYLKGEELITHLGREYYD